MREMTQRQQWLEIMRAARTAGIAILLGMALLTAGTPPADARGGHGIAGRGPHGDDFAGGRRHGNDSYVKAASDERDRLLTTKLKNICRGC